MQVNRQQTVNVGFLLNAKVVIALGGDRVEWVFAVGGLVTVTFKAWNSLG